MTHYRCILAIDTSSLVQSIAVVRDGRLLAERTIRSQAGHASALLGAMDGVLTDAGLSLAALDLLAVGAGPGSFTGLRIGLASLKAIAFARRLPLYPVSSLEALASGVGVGGGLIVPIFDARKGQVYASIFRAGAAWPTRVCEDTAFDPDELAAHLGETLAAEDGAAGVTLCGEAAGRFAPALTAAAAAHGGALHVADGPLGIVRAAQVARLAARDASPASIPDLAMLEPNYQRASEAEINLAARLGS